MSIRTATYTADRGPDRYSWSDDFFDAICGSNPFGSDKVTAPEDDVPTVDSIHSQEFEQLKSLTLQVQERSRSIGVLLRGGAGVGKNHLVSRLFHWAKAEGNAICVYLPNMLSSPQHIPRHFLRSVISELVGGRTKVKQTSLNTLSGRSLLPMGIGTSRQKRRKRSTSKRSICWSTGAKEFRRKSIPLCLTSYFSLQEGESSPRHEQRMEARGGDDRLVVG